MPRRNSDELREERRHSSGRESWIYRANRPDDLRGRHADLLGSALGPDEQFHYLLYAPIFDGVGGPFNIRATPASHAVAVVQGRLIITADTHCKGVPADVHTVPFTGILSVELGAALLLGWLKVCYVNAGQVTSTVVSFSTTGSHHFEAVVRAYRALTARQPTQEGGAIPSADLWRSTPPYLRSATEPLLLEDESVVSATEWRESWQPRKHGWSRVPSCASTPGLLLLTRAGLLWASSEPRVRPDLVSYGVNVTSINWQALRSVSAEHAETSGAAARLRLVLERQGVSTHIEIPLDDDAGQSADAAVDMMERLRASANAPARLHRGP
ncbi:MAG: hypothetical protein NTV05_03450 [Acidobacteria bacterium]|nr:hypothetical protein [Acidobacteriota bacterium]